MLLSFTKGWNLYDNEIMLDKLFRSARWGSFWIFTTYFCGEIGKYLDTSPPPPSSYTTTIWIYKMLLCVSAEATVELQLRCKYMWKRTLMSYWNESIEATEASIIITGLLDYRVLRICWRRETIMIRLLGYIGRSRPSLRIWNKVFFQAAYQWGIKPC